MLNRILVLFAIISFATSAAYAQPDDQQIHESIEFIEELSSEAIAALDNPDLTQAEREDRFRELLREGFDLNYIARLAIGRHWRAMSADQQQRYMEIFPEYVLKIYSNRLTEYGDERFEVGTAVAAGSRDVIVRSRIVRPDGPPVAADWRVRPGNDGYDIIDLKVEGISMVITQRDEFNAKIQKDGLPGLLASLESGAKRGEAIGGDTAGGTTTGRN